MARKFYKTTFKFTILTEDEPVGDVSPTQADYLCTEGPGVGEFEKEKEEELTPKQAADALTQMRSEPGFFQLDENGEEIDG
jgi:hypothetical protein